MWQFAEASTLSRRGLNSRSRVQETMNGHEKASGSDQEKRDEQPHGPPAQEHDLPFGECLEWIFKQKLEH